MRIETASGSESEERARSILEGLLAEYDTARWQFTDRVVVDEGAMGHSHPVLTLGTRFPVRTRIGALSALLHEQIHWYLAARSDACSATITELRDMYPQVPGYREGGARDERSTYLHLVVNWLELESLRSVVGHHLADETLRAACRVPVVYRWIYGRVFEDHGAIGQIVRGQGLADVLERGPSATQANRSSTRAGLADQRGFGQRTSRGAGRDEPIQLPYAPAPDPREPNA